MYCYKCGTKNFNRANFCYKCGTNISHLKNKNVIKPYTTNFLKLYAYNKIIRSKNKYRNTFFLVATAVLSVFFITNLSANFPSTLKYALSTSSSQKVNTTFTIAKAQTELAFRDAWCYILLDMGFIFIFVCDIIIFLYTINIKNKKKY